MAIAAVSFVSCGDDDDEIDDPKKEEEKPGQEAQTLRVYTAAYAGDLLDLYDITLNIYRNGNKQDVVLSTANSVKGYNEQYKKDEYYYYCASVNGVEGVDSVVAVVASKSNIEDIIASKDSDGECNQSCYAVIKDLKKAANGDYSDYCYSPVYSSNHWPSLLTDNKGVITYERVRAGVAKNLSAK